MKTINITTTVIIIFSLFIAFSSCKRNDPVLEVDQEEYDSAEIVFTNLQDPADILKVSFNKEGQTDKSHYHLLKNGQYYMQINLFHNGNNINQEIIDDADEHKFFFLAPTNAISNYIYKDNDLGLTGEVRFGNLDSDFTLTILLRHGLNKEHPAAEKWNSATYQQAGGVDDLQLSIPIHLASEDH